jgi:molybdate transport system ATP-binding protein
MSAPGLDVAYRLQRAGFLLDVELSLPARGVTGLFGVSGSGKTTLLRCIAGLEPAASGRLSLDGDVWEDTGAGVSLPIHERAIGYVFQEPRLFSHLDVRGNLDYAKRRRSAGQPDVDEPAILDLLGIAGLAARRTDELSGGEAQRVAIARALLRGPRLVLMDEPLANLDRARRDEVLPFLDRLHAELSLPILYVSHSIEEICRLCDHLVVIDDGRALASGDLQAVLTGASSDIPGGEDAGSAIETRVVAYDESDDLTRLGFSGGELLVAGRAGRPEQKLRLLIRASDVSICRERPSDSSILNIVPAVIEDVRPASRSLALVRLLVGRDRLLARVTHRSVRELGLESGAQVYAQVKSASIRNVPVVGHLDP